VERKRAATQPRQRKVIALPMDAAFFFERAVQSLDRLHYDKALKYFKRAVEFEPDNPVNYFNMAGILSEMGDFEESNKVLRYLLDTYSGMTECYFYMANNYANMEMFEQAEQAIIRYLEEDPEGQYLEESEEMMEFLSMELERPTRIRTIKCREEYFEHDRARSLLEEGRFHEAVRLLEKLVRRKPEFTAARNNLALGYFYIGRFDLCLETIGEVLDRDPGNLHALCNLALVYRHTGDQERLQALTEALGKIYPFQHEHLFKLATTMGILGRHEEAYRNFRRLLKEHPIEDPCLYHYCAVSAFNTGRYDEAERYWRLSDRVDEDVRRVARFYLSVLDTLGNLPEPRAISYQHQLPFEELMNGPDRDDAAVKQALRRDPLQRASLMWALEHGDEATKLQAIKAMGAVRSGEVQEALRRFLQQPEEDDYLKRVAVFVLRSLGLREPLEAVLDGKRVLIQTETLSPNLPMWSEKWQQVLEMALSEMRGRYDMIQQHDLQTLWVEYLSRVYPNIPRMVKLNGWAAALEYLTAKMHRRAVSYRDVADRYGVSVTTVRTIVDRIDTACGVREKMEAIFPQFGGKL
jgi:tetratricopeptide (TPR) repeat protein